jgi:H+/Cl- antiporter ClcA
VLLVIAAIVGVIVALAAWGFLELIYQIQQELYTHLPHALGYPNGPPLWWPIPVLFIAGVLVALVITRLPGEGGHIPAKGLAAGGPPPGANVLPGVVLAGVVSIGFGAVVGPEAPLIALGTGLAVLSLSLARREAPPQVLLVIAAAGAFSAVSFIFGSPLLAAVLMLEVAGIGGPRLPLVLLPGLLAAGIGSLVSIGMGAWTGLSTSAFSLSLLQLPKFGRPTIAEFGWTILFAAVVAVVGQLIMRGGLLTYALARRRALLVPPLAGLLVAGLAIAFAKSSGKNFTEVLFSGQDALAPLVSQAGTWTLGALALLVVFKGLAYSLSLGSFRGGPTFPALLLGAAAGLMAAHLPGYSIDPAVAVGIAAGTATILRLPLTAVLIGTYLTINGGVSDEPLVIVGVVVAYLITLVISPPRAPEPEAGPADAGKAAVPAAAGAAS